VRAAVARAELSVHLLDTTPGRDIDDQEGITYEQRQAELALDHGKSQLILMPQGAAPVSTDVPRYAEFLDRLEHGPRRPDASYVFQRELPSAMTRQILARVEQLNSRRPAPAGTMTGTTLLDTHIKDQLHAFELGQYLLKRQVSMLINPQEDDPARNVALFSERLKQVAILIIFYGSVRWEWVRERLSLALQIAVAEEYPLRACGVYIAPPVKPNTATTFSLPLVSLEWMDHTQGFNPAAVDHLLARAQATGGAAL
jgi:hypothetical protein